MLDCVAASVTAYLLLLCRQAHVLHQRLTDFSLYHKTKTPSYVLRLLLPCRCARRCCLRRTCADTDPTTAALDPQACPAGSFPDSSKSSFSPPSAEQCCKFEPSCNDTLPDVPGCQPYECDASRGLVFRVNATDLDPSDAKCCLVSGGWLARWNRAAAAGQLQDMGQWRENGNYMWALARCRICGMSTCPANSSDCLCVAYLAACGVTIQ